MYNLGRAASELQMAIPFTPLCQLASFGGDTKSRQCQVQVSDPLLGLLEPTALHM